MEELEKLIEINQTQLKELLNEGENILILGNKGLGKSTIVREYAKEKGKKLKIISLASWLPEFVGGIPYVENKAGKKEYFSLTLLEELEEVFQNEGENWVIFFDEINQTAQEVANTLYSICHIDKTQRNWAGHSLAKAQIIGAGNLNDGTDGTVYLNELPTPLMDRFFVFKLVGSDKDVLKYLKEKYKNIPQVSKYIKAMQEENINPRNIDKCLEVLQYERNPLLLHSKLGVALATKILRIKEGIKNDNPAERLKAGKKLYQAFKEDGSINWGTDTITDEVELIDRLKEVLTAEEVASIVKGAK